MSSGVTKCQVGRITWVRRDPPLLERALDVGIRGVRHAKSSPLGGFVFLGLNGAQPLDDIGWLAMPRAIDALVLEATFGDLTAHARMTHGRLLHSRPSGRAFGRTTRRRHEDTTTSWQKKDAAFVESSGERRPYPG